MIEDCIIQTGKTEKKDLKLLEPEINKIHFYKPKIGNKVSKIEFILDSENIMFRNDLGVEWMIKYLAS